MLDGIGPTTAAKVLDRMAGRAAVNVHGQARVGDKHLYALRTRFIPASIAGDFENRVWPSAAMAAGTTGYHAASDLSVDLAARMRGKWRGSGT